MTNGKSDDKGKEKDIEKTKQEKSIPFWNWYLLDGRGPPPTPSSLRQTVKKHLEREQLNKKAALYFEREKEIAFKKVEDNYGTRNAGLLGGLTSSKPDKKEIRRLYKEKKDGRQKRRDSVDPTEANGGLSETQGTEKGQEPPEHLEDGVGESDSRAGKDGSIVMSGANAGSSNSERTADLVGIHDAGAVETAPSVAGTEPVVGNVAGGHTDGDTADPT